MRADHRRVLDVAAQGDAARRAPLAHARGDQSPAAARRWRARASGARTSRIALAAAAAWRRRRGPAVRRRRSGATKRTGANMRAPAATAARQMISSSCLRGSTASAPGHVDAAAARRDAADVVAGCASRHHLRRARRACAARGARRGSGRRRRPCRAETRARRPARRRGRRARACCAAALPAGPAPTTITSQRSGRRSRSRFMSGRRRWVLAPAAGRGAGAHAPGGDASRSAVIAPTSAKVSWNAASGVAGMRAQPPLEHDADQADADRAAELAQEVDRARALRDQRRRAGRCIEPRLSDGRTQPEADAADHGPQRDQRTATSPVPTPSISEERRGEQHQARR